MAVSKRRGVVMTLLTTLLFHVCAMFYGILLMVMLGLTFGGLGLVLLCALSTSTRSSRLFVAWLWRNELWINARVEDKQTESERLAQERQRGLRREASQRGAAGMRLGSSSASAAPASLPISRSSSTRGREVTLPVMVFSVVYFLLFKGVFNVIFAVMPLVLWWIAAAQVVPSLAPGKDMVMADDTTSRVFVALATSFFAYQIGVAAASGSVWVSEKFQEALFREDAAAASVHSPLLTSNLFHDAPRYSAAPQLSLHRIYFDERQELRESSSLMTAADPRSTGGGSSGSAPPLAPPAPAAPPAPPADPRYLFGAFPPIPPMATMPGGQRRPDHPIESAFQAEPETREMEFCGIKVTIQSRSADEQDQQQTHSGGGGRGGRGAGSFRGYSHRGGRRGGMGRGAFFRPEMPGGMMDPSSLPPPPPPYGSFDVPFATSEPGSEVFARVVTEEEVRRSAVSMPPIASPVFARSCSTSPRGQRRGGGSRKGGGGGRLRRSDSFDSGHPAGGRFAPDIDLKHGAHTRLWEALDLRPSAPNLTEEYPMARPSDQISLSPAMQYHMGHKSWSENGHRGRATFAEDYDTGTSTGFRKFDMFAAKQRLKEQSRQLKEAAKDLKRQYKEQVKRDAREAARRTEEHKQYVAEQGRYAREFARAEEQRAKDMERTYARQDMQQKQAEAQRWQVDAQAKFSTAETQKRHAMEVKAAERAVEQLLRFQAASQNADDEGKYEELPPRPVEELSTSYRVREQQIQTRDEHAMEIERAADEEIERQRRELEASGDPLPPEVRPIASTDAVSVRHEPVRVRGRRAATSLDSEVPTAADVDDRAFVSRGEKRRGSSAGMLNVVNAYQTGALTDQEIQAMWGSLSRPSDDQVDLSGLSQFSFTSSPAVIHTLETTPLYRGFERNAMSPSTLSASGQRGYDLLSPVGSLTNSFSNNSFLESRPYDVLSPTNSLHDADFPSEEFQHVYRSIRFSDDHNRVVPSQNSALPHYEDVPGQRDKVHFCSYAPPSVCPSKQSFRFSVWAFLRNQRSEVRERAEAADPDAKQLSINTKLNVRRGAIVHVTLEAPEGFKILNGATQGFPWEGKISSVAYDIECTDNADFGQVLFKATIVVGTEVAVLRSYVIVSSRKLDREELEAKMLDSELEVLDMTYQEIPYPTLELKEFVGSGYFGDAYRASYKGEDVVVKTIRASEFGETNDQILKEFQHEAAVLSMFGHHPCVVPFVGASTDMRYPLSLITKYLPFGSLEDSLKNPGMSSSLSTHQRTRMLKDAAAGLLNIHEGGFIHRDVAARNCLVDSDLRVKICDFGLCRRVNAYGGSLMKESVGPIKYMAPESLQPPHSFSYESDSWMFGVLMWETYTATPPFRNKTPIEAGMAVLEGERLPVPKDLPEDLQMLMELCFHESPSQRPSMAEILAELDRAMMPKTAPAKHRAVPNPQASIASAVASSNGRTPPVGLGRHDFSIVV